MSVCMYVCIRERKRERNREVKMQRRGYKLCLLSGMIHKLRSFAFAYWYDT
jgi:hypothetical protein